MASSHVTRQGVSVSGYSRHPGMVWLEQHHSSLPDDKWVAADASGLVAEAGTRDLLLSALHRLQRPRDEVAIMYVSREAV